VPELVKALDQLNEEKFRVSALISTIRAAVPSRFALER
jgi:hypothetical protein